MSIPDVIQLGFDSPKLCECGCGNPAPIARADNRTKGRIKGQPVRFISGHNGRIPMPPLPAIPKLCECGCGEPTKIAARTHTYKGHVKGQPFRYIAGHQKGGPEEAGVVRRLWAKVDKSGGPDACWVSSHCGHKSGYTHLKIRGLMQLTHRVVWELTNGPVPDELCVLHHCDNRPCCNPRHLFLGTKMDNYLDMLNKGREVILRGERNPAAKLTRQQVEDIRKQRASGVSRPELAKQYGISLTHVTRITQRTHWKSVA